MGTYYTNYIKVKVAKAEEEIDYEKLEQRMNVLFSQIITEYMKLDTQICPVFNVENIDKYVSDNLKSHGSFSRYIDSEYYMKFDFKYGNMEFYKDELEEILKNEKDLSLQLFSMEENNANDLSGLSSCKDMNYGLYDEINELKKRTNNE